MLDTRIREQELMSAWRKGGVGRTPERPNREVEEAEMSRAAHFIRICIRTGPQKRIFSKSVTGMQPFEDELKYQIRNPKHQTNPNVGTAHMAQTIRRLRFGLPGDEIFVNQGECRPTLTANSVSAP